MVITSTKDTGGIAIPAVTISAINPETTTGWRNATKDKYDIVQTLCNLNTSIELKECITSNTFEKEQTFKDVLLGYSSRKSLVNSTVKSLWTADLTRSWYGRMYTLNIPQKIGPNDKTDQLFITFDYDRVKRIYIHDPRFYIPNSNPVGLPSTKYLKVYPATMANTYYRLALTEVEEMDVAADPCNTDPQYSLQVRKQSGGVSKKLLSELCEFKLGLFV